MHTDIDLDIFISCLPLHVYNVQEGMGVRGGGVEICLGLEGDGHGQDQKHTKVGCWGGGVGGEKTRRVSPETSKIVGVGR